MFKQECVYDRDQKIKDSGSYTIGNSIVLPPIWITGTDTFLGTGV